MRLFLLNILLAITWAALLGEFTATNLLAGFVFGYLMLWVMQYVMEASNYSVKVLQIISFAAYFLWELLWANLRVAYNVLAPYDRMRPGIIAIPLDIETDVEITLLANLITLTPGTLSLDVSDDRRTLYIHNIYVSTLEDAKLDIKQGFERKIREVFE